VLASAPPFDPEGRTVWIDALFGTGLQRPLEGTARAWVERFNAATGPKLCVDIPSGLHGDTGQVLGIACRGDVTVTFVAPKLGMTVGEGPGCCGRIVVAALGLP
jgi:NAD(P)H-hydrate epimerase